MGDTTKIEWTDHTFNAWWGCSRVSPACRFCYADRDASRWGHDLWRRHGERKPMSEDYWRKPARWNREAERAGKRAKVFCASMSDVFEDHPQVGPWRTRLFEVIEQTPWLIWQLLTKRIENVSGMVPWTGAWPRSVWIGTSVENQRFASQRIPFLESLTGAAVRFLSCEPLLGPVDLSPWIGEHMPWSYTEFGVLCSCGAAMRDERCTDLPISWVISGGESGPKARPSHPAWFRSLRDQCTEAGVPYLHKQWGEWAPESMWVHGDNAAAAFLSHDGRYRRLVNGKPTAAPMARGEDVTMRRAGKKAAGRLLDGRTWDEYPSVTEVVPA